MGEDNPGLFVVCALDDIAPGTARPFTLSRAGEADAGRPVPILIVRMSDDVCVGYVNACPHDGVWLNVGDGEFFSPDGAFLRCGRHGAAFDIVSGRCVWAEFGPNYVSKKYVFVFGVRARRQVVVLCFQSENVLDHIIFVSTNIGQRKCRT